MKHSFFPIQIVQTVWVKADTEEAAINYAVAKIHPGAVGLKIQHDPQRTMQVQEIPTPATDPSAN